MKLREEVSRGMSFFLVFRNLQHTGHLPHTGLAAPGRWVGWPRCPWITASPGFPLSSSQHGLAYQPLGSKLWEIKGDLGETRIRDLTLVFPVDQQREKRKIGGTYLGGCAAKSNLCHHPHITVLLHMEQETDRGEWIRVCTWLRPFAVHLELSWHC